jgi:hypothetical protein
LIPVVSPSTFDSISCSVAHSSFSDLITSPVAALWRRVVMTVLCPAFIRLPVSRYCAFPSLATPARSSAEYRFASARFSFFRMLYARSEGRTVRRRDWDRPVTSNSGRPVLQASSEGSREMFPK